MTITARGFTLFETQIGACGIVWGINGIVGVQLPETDDDLTRARLKRRSGGAQEASPPPAVQAAVQAITALLAGRPSDLSQVALDMRDVPPFHQRVYAVARTIPVGSRLSYGEIAVRLGEPAWPAAREVGQALGRNPFPIVVPCHRVVAAGGKLGGFSAPGGLATKRRLLSIENGTGSTELTTRTQPPGSTAAFNIPLFADLP